ncbi:MAG: alpha/beta fold hydrolase [Clostridiales bacterium]
MKKIITLITIVILLVTISVIALFSTLSISAATSQNPVIMVHGLTGSGSNFSSIESYLQQNGWDSSQMEALDLPSKMGDQTSNSAAIEKAVDNMLQKTGASEVDIVAHSMGGANSLYYIVNKNGADKVDKVVTLGGANGLTTSRVPAGIELTSITGTADTIVASSLSNISGADTISVPGASHIGLLTNSTVKKDIVDILSTTASSGNGDNQNNSETTSNGNSWDLSNFSSYFSDLF